jgi:uncharacterized protein (DUF1697 family)
MEHSLSMFIALLRGINVGGRTMVPMAQLKNNFEHLGFQNVRTYINSGNVIFEAPLAMNPRQLESAIEAELKRAYSFDIRVIVRTAQELAQTVRSIPPSWQDRNGVKCNVIFLHHSIDSPQLLERLQPKPDIESLHYHPGVLFWSANTSDLTKSNMIKLSRSPLYQAMTVRNLNTLLALYKLTCA